MSGLRVWLLVVGGVALVAGACSSNSSGKPAGGGDAAAGASGTGVAGTTGAGGAGTGGAGVGGAGVGGAGMGVAGMGVAGAAGGAGVGGAGGTGTAGVGGAGAGGTGGAAGTGAAGVGGPDTSASVLTRNKHQSRDGFYIQPTLPRSRVYAIAYDNFNATFEGGLYGSPLYLENGPAGKGAFFVGTTSNNVYALDETTGAIVWMHNIGQAPAKTGVPCGNVAPVGIISTPVIDEASRTLFVAGAIGDANGIVRHEVHALSVDTGLERTGWPVNVSAMAGPGGVAFNSKAQNQRAALSLVNGFLYVPYGGHGGDCDQYRGWVVAINIAAPTQAGAWATGGIGEGIWAPGGMASAGEGVFAVTGNNTAGATTHADSEEVVHVTGLAQVNRSTGIFFPASWRAMDVADADFGSSSPVVFRVAGATPSLLVAAVTKNGLFYLLDANNLGSMDGHLAKLSIAPEATAMSVKAGLVAYTTPTSTMVVLPAQNTASFCPAGSAYQGSVAVQIVPGSPPTAKVAWCGIGGEGSPIVTSTDGKNETVVWVWSNGLFALDGETGKLLAGVPTKVCPGVHKMFAPIAVKGRIIVGGDGNLCSYSPH